MKKVACLAFPFMVISLLASCVTTKSVTYNITFDANGGCFDNDPTITQKVITVKKGEMPEEPSHPSKPYNDANETHEWVFNAWDSEISPANEDKTYFATYTLNTFYKVTFDTLGGTPIAPTLVKEGNKLSRPDNPIKEDSKYIYEFEKWVKKDNPEEEYDFDSPVTSDLALKATYTQTSKEYVANATDTENLKFYLLPDYTEPIENHPITAGEKFVFYMEAISPSNGEIFCVPNTLDITIGGRFPIFPTFLDIEQVEDNAHAKVTIVGNVIAGDIQISGNAIKMDTYHFDVYKQDELAYGSNATDPERREMEKNEDLVVNFSTTDEYQLPEAKNICVYFDSEDKWVTPTEEFGEGEDYCTYNSSGELTINHGKVENYIIIVARLPDCPLLEKCSWEDIDWLSTMYSDIVDVIFYIGETKTLVLDNLTYSVRIIGFNHDDLADGSGKAGITFEFANVISNSDKKAKKMKWNSKSGANKNFPTSSLNDYVTSLYGNLSEDLKPYIKTVSKKVGEGSKYVATPYDTKLFPLCGAEFSDVSKLNFPKGEGEIYEYYNIHKKPKDNFRKKDLKGSYAVYWLRSPNTYYDPRANVIADDDGDFEWRYIDDKYETSALAPAFCI